MAQESQKEAVEKIKSISSVTDVRDRGDAIFIDVESFATARITFILNNVGYEFHNVSARSNNLTMMFKLQN